MSSSTPTSTAAPTTAPAPLLEASHVHKRYPGVYALNDVSLDVRPGEVLALVGENGAGKSTLMKILSGAVQLDEGEIRLDGQPVQIPDPHAAIALGIGIIYQELSLVDVLSVAENIFLGDLPTRGGRPWQVDWPLLYARTQELLDRVGSSATPRTQTSELSVAQKQMVEIARALARNVRVLILDEPTSSLTAQETEKLFEIIRSLQARGVGIVYISHRLEEVFEIAQRVTVLRDGQLVGTLPVAEADEDTLVRMMVGRDLSHMYPGGLTETGSVRLEVRNLSRAGVLDDVSFSVRAGEVVGLAGLVGAGRTELARCIFGADPISSGEILLDGRPVKVGSPGAAVKLGIALVPEDRKLQALILGMAVRENMTLPVLPRLGSNPAVPSKAKEKTLVEEYIRNFRIRTPTMEQRVGALSGGNQQKVVIARWIAADPKVLILDEPTRGIDVGAKAEVHALIADLAARGVAILLISSELPEVMGMSHRILVMREGRLVADIPRAEASEEAIMSAAAGRVATAA